MTDNSAIQIIPGIQPIHASNLDTFDGAAAVVTSRYCEDNYHGKLPFAGTVPVVDFYGPTECSVPGAVIVTSNNEMIGRMAANEFLQRGLLNLAFFGVDSKYYFSGKRFEGMCSVAGTMGISVSKLGFSLKEYERMWIDEAFDISAKRKIKEWLGKLEKPVGILITTDRFYHHILPLCQELGLRIPQDVAIIGVNNNSDCCTLSEITLSSIDTNRYQIGWCIGEMLESIIRGDSVRQKEVLIDPKGVVLRDSSSFIATKDRLVATALSMIMERAREHLTVKEVAEQLQVSRSNLDKRFKKALGITAGKAIELQRIKHIRKMLLETTFSLARISEMTGFSRQPHFTRYFKHLNGMTPSAYRQSRGWSKVLV